MAEIAEPLVLPEIEQDKQTKSKESLEPGYLVICWDDPVNLMDFVTHVFQAVFAWAKPKAEFHMLQELSVRLCLDRFHFFYRFSFAVSGEINRWPNFSAN